MMKNGLFPPHRLGINTDLYELTMMASYLDHDMTFEATFELFVRNFPADRGFVLASGIHDALEYLERLRFEEDEIEYLRNTPPFNELSDSFFEHLNTYEFTGDVNCVPEGTPVFSEEPIIQVTAPLPDAQILETFLLSIVNYQSLIATKADRVARAAGDCKVIDFGMRRAHGPWAALWAARASYLGGCDGTSNLLAGSVYDIPVVGTAAHSYTMASPSELESFERYHDTYPENTVLLIDTYDIEEGAKNAVKIGNEVKAVRIDSGDLADEAHMVRDILDDAGMEDTEIILSGGLDEYRIKKIVDGGTPVNSFGVGTRLITSADAPYLDVVYKLVEETSGGSSTPRMKTSKGKETIPGKKQVFREYRDGTCVQDIMGYHTENLPGKPLLQPAYRDGERVMETGSLDEQRERAHENVDVLPEAVKKIKDPDDYPVELSDKLREFKQRGPVGE